jgi:predicted nucleic acid-binding protein
MFILDSNLWVFGTLKANERAITLLDEIERGDTTSAVDAYILHEVLAAFGRVQDLTPTERDEYRTLFLTRLTRMTGLLEAPSQRDAAAANIETVRHAPEIRLLAHILDIQPKDVPILVLAYRYYDRAPTILTNDEAFAAFDPAAHALDQLTIEHVP